MCTQAPTDPYKLLLLTALLVLLLPPAITPHSALPQCLHVVPTTKQLQQCHYKQHYCIATDAAAAHTSRNAEHLLELHQQLEVILRQLALKVSFQSID
jgi:hypothetical protein